MQRLKKKTLKLDTTKIRALSNAELAKTNGGGASDGAVCEAAYYAWWRVFTC